MTGAKDRVIEFQAKLARSPRLYWVYSYKKSKGLLLTERQSNQKGLQPCGMCRANEGFLRGHLLKASYKYVVTNNICI